MADTAGNGRSGPRYYFIIFQRTHYYIIILQGLWPTLLATVDPEHAARSWAAQNLGGTNYGKAVTSPDR
jgi:hypothetical protein